jgi:ATP-dependent DNA ligase
MVGAPPPVLVSRRSRRRRLTHRVPRGAARFLFAAINWFGMPDHGEATKVRRSAAQKQGAPDPIHSAPTASLPQFIPPQLAMLVDKPPAGDRWVHEIKHDGYRTAARIEAGQARMLTRNGLDWTTRFGPIVNALAELRVKTAYLDGEIVVVRRDGVSSFADLQEALSLGQAPRLCYYAFRSPAFGWPRPDRPAAPTAKAGARIPDGGACCGACALFGARHRAGA